MACCCAAVKLLGAMILFDSGQMTCDSFKSSGLDVEELDAVDDVFRSNVELLEIFVCVFDGDEDGEDFNVDGLAGTRKTFNQSTPFIMNIIHESLPDGGTTFSGTSIGAGIGGLRIGFLS